MQSVLGTSAAVGFQLDWGELGDMRIVAQRVAS